MRFFHKLITLQTLILLLATASTTMAIGSILLISYSTHKNTIIDSTLEHNGLYAQKLALTTERFIHSRMQELEYSADIIGKGFDDPTVLEAEARRLQLQSDIFNSVLIIDSQGLVKGIWPNIANLRGRRIDTEGTREALRERRLLVSKVFTSAAGNLVIFISYPVLDAGGGYLGYVGGTIHLHKQNALSALLETQPYRDDTYLYVIDRDRRLLYHPDRARVGEIVGANVVVDQLVQGQGGTQPVVNSQGVEMLAGFAPIPSTGWGIVAQRPADAALVIMDQWLFDIARSTLPLWAISIVGIWWFSRLIARPLQQLAEAARQIDEADAAHAVERVDTWYYESRKLKAALLTGLKHVHHKIGVLSHDVLTDPLTGLHNRRGMELALTSLLDMDTPFSLIALDIDHFKHVNDAYGHAVGDQVLQALALEISSGARTDDTLCRTGGEEFLIVLPDTAPDLAEHIAERIRRQVAQAPMPIAEGITISLGVAHWPTDERDIDATVRLADKMLYAAKNAGRNRVVSARRGAVPAPLGVA